MSKNTNIADLINYISVDGSGNVVLTTGGQVATQSYVTTAVSNLVNAAPSTLDTLNELAAALGNDANFATTVTSSIATRLPLSGGTLTGNLNYSVGNGIDWYINAPTTNGATFRLKSHSGAAGYNNRSGALAWIDGNGVRADVLGYTDSSIIAYQALTATSATFSGLITANAGLLLSTSQSITTAGSIGYNNAVGVFIYGRTGSEADFRIYNRNGLTAMSVIANTQNVEFLGSIGIGISNPSYKLHVIGTSLFDNSSFGAAQVRLKGVGTTTGFDLLNDTNDGYLWNRDSGNIYFATANTERMRLTSAGNLAVGTTSPITFTGYNTVSVNGTSGGAFVTMSNGSSALRLACGTGDSALWEVRNVPMMIGINNQERMRLQTDGFVRFGVSQANTLIASTGTNGTIYMYQNGTPTIYLESSGSVIFNNPNGVMINTTTPVGRLHVTGGVVISNGPQTFRRVLLNFGQAGTFSQVKVFFNKNNWGSVTYDIKLASAGGSYHTAGAYYSNPGFSSHINSINAGNGPTMTLVADSQTGSTQGAIWTFSGATMIHPMVTIDMACGNGYQIDPNDVVVQFI